MGRDGFEVIRGLNPARLRPRLKSARMGRNLEISHYFNGLTRRGAITENPLPGLAAQVPTWHKPCSAPRQVAAPAAPPGKFRGARGPDRPAVFLRARPAPGRQRPVWSLDPRAPASKSFTRIARRLLASPRRRGRGAASSPLGVVGSALNNRKDTGNDYHG